MIRTVSFVAIGALCWPTKRLLLIEIVLLLALASCVQQSPSLKTPKDEMEAVQECDRIGVRTGSKVHLSFDHRDVRGSQADLIAFIDLGSIANSRRAGDNRSRHIGLESDGGVEAVKGVVIKRLVSDGSVVAPGKITTKRSKSVGRVVVASVARKCPKPGGRISIAKGVVKKRLHASGSISDAKTVVTECIDPAGCIDATRCVAMECVDPSGGIGIARCVVKKCEETGGGITEAGSVEKKCIDPARSVVVAPA
jgi:hypothetical protein